MNATTKTLTFETPEWNRGQIVTHSFARTPTDSTIVKRHDGWDDSVRFTWMATGRKLTARELERYGLTTR